MKLICATCETEMIYKKKGIIVFYLSALLQPYQAWFADLKVCTDCETEVIDGFADNPYWTDFSGGEPPDEKADNVYTIYPI